MIYQYISYNLYLYYLWQIEQMEDVLDFSLGKIYGDTIHYEKLGKNGGHFYIQEHTLARLKLRTNDHIFQVSLTDTYLIKNFKNASEIEVETFYNNFCKKVLINTSSIYELIYRFTIIKQKMDIYITVFLLSIYIFCWSYLLITADFSHI